MSVSKVAETNVGAGHKGYKEESVGKTLPLPAVEEMDGAACNLLHIFSSVIFVRERWEYVLYLIFSCGANKFAHCIRNKVESGIFFVFPPS